MDSDYESVMTVDKVVKEDLADKEITQLFRKVFTTHEGKLVLHQILIDLRYFDEVVTENDIALNNYAKFMINKRLKIDNTYNRLEKLLDAGEFKQSE